MIKVLYFARIAELTGLRQEQFGLAAPTPVGALLQSLGQQHPSLIEVKNLKVAINQSHARADAIVQPGDEVALFEPVTGG